jgi:hypothetical protein
MIDMFGNCPILFKSLLLKKYLSNFTSYLWFHSILSDFLSEYLHMTSQFFPRQSIGNLFFYETSMESLEIGRENVIFGHFALNSQYFDSKLCTICGAYSQLFVHCWRISSIRQHCLLENQGLILNRSRNSRNLMKMKLLKRLKLH